MFYIKILAGKNGVIEKIKQKISVLLSKHQYAWISDTVKKNLNSI